MILFTDTVPLHLTLTSARPPTRAWEVARTVVVPPPSVVKCLREVFIRGFGVLFLSCVCIVTCFSLTGCVILFTDTFHTRREIPFTETVHTCAALNPHLHICICVSIGFTQPEILFTGTVHTCAALNPHSRLYMKSPGPWSPGASSKWRLRRKRRCQLGLYKILIYF